MVTSLLSLVHKKCKMCIKKLPNPHIYFVKKHHKQNYIKKLGMKYELYNPA